MASGKGPIVPQTTNQLMITLHVHGAVSVQFPNVALSTHANPLQHP